MMRIKPKNSKLNQMKRAFWRTLNVFSTQLELSSRKLSTMTSNFLKTPKIKIKAHSQNILPLKYSNNHKIKTPNNDNKYQKTVLQSFHNAFATNNTKV
jgi:hypothetical protein